MFTASQNLQATRGYLTDGGETGAHSRRERSRVELSGVDKGRSLREQDAGIFEKGRC